MKKILKALGIIILVIVAIGAGGFIYMNSAFPKAEPPSDLKVELTPERIEHGKYLANHVMLCMDCHAERDFSRFSGPPKPGTLGAGGDRFDETMGFPGVFYARNITPAGIGDWTDGEIYRLITTGVTRDNEVIFPVMPYNNYAKCDPEDIKDVIAYLRSLQPVQKQNTASEAAFPLNFLLKTMNATPAPQKKPSKDDLVAYGKYVANMAACNECHTAVDDKGSFIGIPYSGGRAFKFPDGTILRSGNITPDPTSGIGNWTEEYFITRFKMHQDSTMAGKPVGPDGFQTIMPWMMYAGMDSSDLKAIYIFLKSLEPVDNKVIKVTRPGT
ncbi:MAG: cytochrome C [Chitinophagaceae bacterium]|nr:cytochrome C [Chitinophagaceae bacterium]